MVRGGRARLTDPDGELTVKPCAAVTDTGQVSKRAGHGNGLSAGASRSDRGTAVSRGHTSSAPLRRRVKDRTGRTRRREDRLDEGCQSLPILGGCCDRVEDVSFPRVFEERRLGAEQALGQKVDEPRKREITSEPAVPARFVRFHSHAALVEGCRCSF